MASLEEARKAEFRKYVKAYATGTYCMKPARLDDATADLMRLPVRGSYLDVSCGYGDVLRNAEALGFAPVRGTEIMPELIDGRRVVYAEAHALPFPDKSFDVVSMFDVIEHLVRPDDQAACGELLRVARRHVLITANNQPSRNHIGEDLHVNVRPYAEWDRFFREWFGPGAAVTWLDRNRKDQGHYASNAWRIDLP
jgi:ubiquinone/menaquinone biosynthesis C-methylase UbiE